jgi:monofunctional glycosyltransferase
MKERLKRLQRLVTWLHRIAVGAVLVMALLVLVGMLAPMPSTLMLGRWVTGQPVTRDWVPLSAMSPHLKKAVIASEDQRFCVHSGVDFEVLKEVLDNEDGPTRGGSTLTMQVVKNVYLWPGRSYVRKAIEIPLSLVVDLVWGKRRVLEVYLNVAEWGDGVFGAEAAAQVYFGKSARHLTAVEAARFAAALPNPHVRDPAARSRNSQRIVSRMQGIDPYISCIQ